MDIEAAIRDLEGDIQSVIRQRMTEIRKTIGEAPLGAILLIGSTLEGILIEVAIQHSTTFVAATAAPERDGKTAPINQWRLNSLIDVAYELGFVSRTLSDSVMSFATIETSLIHEPKLLLNSTPLAIRPRSASKCSRLL